MIFFCGVSSCLSAQKVDDLKSPCVGIHGSPCDHRPVNDWWLGKTVYTKDRNITNISRNA